MDLVFDFGIDSSLETFVRRRLKMNKPRFRLDKAQRSFECYNCSKQLSVGNEFAWDNERNGTRICINCLDLLSDALERGKNEVKAQEVIKTESERLKALEEQVETMSWQILHLKSLWYNEMRTIHRTSKEATVRALNPSPRPKQDDSTFEPEIELKPLASTVQKIAEDVDLRAHIDEDEILF
jgi:hypothetical protein